jgi:hypothetical protein
MQAAQDAGVPMPETERNVSLPVTMQEARVIVALRESCYGELRVFIRAGIPVRFERVESVVIEESQAKQADA